MPNRYAVIKPVDFSNMKVFEPPIELLANTLKSQQAQYNQRLADLDAIKTLYPEAGLLTEDVREALKTKYDTQISSLTDELMKTGNITGGDAAIRNLALQIPEDPLYKMLKKDQLMREAGMKSVVDPNFKNSVQNLTDENGNFIQVDPSKITSGEYTESDLLGQYSITPAGPYAQEDLKDINFFKERVENIHGEGQWVQDPISGKTFYQKSDNTKVFLTEEFIRDIMDEGLGMSMFESSLSKPGGLFRQAKMEQEFGEFNYEMYRENFIDNIRGQLFTEEDIDTSMRSGGTQKSAATDKPLSITTRTDTVVTGDPKGDYIGGLDVTSVEESLNKHLKLKEQWVGLEDKLNEQLALDYSRNNDFFSPEEYTYKKELVDGKPTLTLIDNETGNAVSPDDMTPEQLRYYNKNILRNQAQARSTYFNFKKYEMINDRILAEGKAKGFKYIDNTAAGQEVLKEAHAYAEKQMRDDLEEMSTSYDIWTNPKENMLASEKRQQFREDLDNLDKETGIAARQQYMKHYNKFLRDSGYGEYLDLMQKNLDLMNSVEMREQTSYIGGIYESKQQTALDEHGKYVLNHVLADAKLEQLEWVVDGAGFTSQEYHEYNDLISALRTKDGDVSMTIEYIHSPVDNSMKAVVNLTRVNDDGEVTTIGMMKKDGVSETRRTKKQKQNPSQVQFEVALSDTEWRNIARDIGMDDVSLLVYDDVKMATTSLHATGAYTINYDNVDASMKLNPDAVLDESLDYTILNVGGVEVSSNDTEKLMIFAHNMNIAGDLYKNGYEGVQYTEEDTKDFIRQSAALNGFNLQEDEINTIYNSFESKTEPSTTNNETDYNDYESPLPQSFLSAIDSTEAGAKGYNATYELADYDVDLVNMTLKEVMDFNNPTGEYAQKVRKVRTDGRDEPAGPVGRYQFMNTTLDDIIKKNPDINLNDKFTPELQDRLALLYARERLSHVSSPKAKREVLKMVWDGFNKLSDEELNQIVKDLEA